MLIAYTYFVPHFFCLEGGMKYKKWSILSVYFLDPPAQMFLLRQVGMHLAVRTFVNKTDILIVYFASMNTLFSAESKPICLIPSMSITKALIAVKGTSIECCVSTSLFCEQYLQESYAIELVRIERNACGEKHTEREKVTFLRMYQ